MKGDYSRRTFDERKHYSAVLHDQGRMLSEADLEEEHRILAYRIEREAADLIGGCGGPLGAAGFAITKKGSVGLSIGDGRYYVDGILVENEDKATAFDKQPDRYDVEALTKLKPGRYLAYLDVWRRLITAIDDPTIREVALGGPTTSGRERTIWQVRLVQAAATAHCLSALPALKKTDGLLAARAIPGDDTDDPCIVPPTAGFKGLENQFYRVEIHDEGDAYNLTTNPGSANIPELLGEGRTKIKVGSGSWAKGDRVEIYRSGVNVDPLPADLFVITNVDTTGRILTLNRPHQPMGPADAPRIRKAAATFVWSRDNGSVVAAIDAVNGTDITVRDLGPDDVRGFQVGQWVEITDDGRELEGKPGALGWVQEILVAQRTVRLTAAPDAPWLDKARHPKLRRWDGAGAVRFNNPAPGKEWIALEDGIQIRFTADVTAGLTAAHYRSGDYWHFPARAITLDPASGNIDWPQEAGSPKLLPPHGVIHHTCPLAIVDLTSDKVSVVDDCRNLFPPVTELTNLLYVGGDGQEGLPDLTKPKYRDVVLDAPLQVRVANGEHPVKGAQVRFSIVLGDGRLQGTTNTVVPVPTDLNGIATCAWQLDSETQHQQVEATLLDAGNAPISHQVVRFHASLSQASRVAYDPKDCPDLKAADVKTVQQAIDALCQRESQGGCCCVVVGPGGEFARIDEAVLALLERGESDLCLCLLPGDHEVPGELRVVNKDPERRVNLKIAGCGWSTRLSTYGGLIFHGLSSLVLSELDITYSFGGDNEHGWMELDQVRHVHVESCRFTGFTIPMPLLTIGNATAIYIGNSTFRAFRAGIVTNGRRFFEGLNELSELFDLHGDFGSLVRKTAVVLAERSLDERKQLSAEILERLQAFDRELSTGEKNAYLRLARALPLDPSNPFALVDHMIAMWEAVGRVVPGVAIIVGPMTDDRETVTNLGRIRQTELIVENNVISGIISLYGPPPLEEITNARLNKTLRDSLRNRSVRLSGLSGNVHLRNNHLTRVLIASGLVTMLDRLAGTRGALDTLFKSLHVTDNVIDGQYNLFVAQHVSLASNNFTLDAYRPRVIGPDDDDVFFEFPNTVIADSAVYTGNHGQSRSPNFTIQVTIHDTTRVSERVANLELTVSP